MKDKKFLRPTIIGFCLLLLSMLLVGIFGITDAMNGGSGQIYLDGVEVNYGLKASIGYYFQLWRPSAVPHEVGYIGLVLVLVAIFTTVTLIVMSIVKKKPIYIIPALLLGAAIAFLPFIFLLVVPMVQLAALRGIAMLFMAGATGLNLFAIYFLVLACGDMLKDSLAVLNKAAGEQPKEEQQAQAAAVEGLTEEQVREIVEKYLAEHVEEKHNQEEAPAPVAQPEPEQEEEIEEEAEDEEEVEEAPADDNAPSGLNIKGKRRRASFETRLKNSEFDIRHKYYDLRDYIKWYGLRNRVSIPGDTFSYKRQRYVFVTIVGKHIRVYFNLDPNNYADSAIPVEQAQAKKYEDLPCLLKVKSNLSYRRAKKLVDDLMEKMGIAKPDEDEPKETQQQQ